MPGPPGETIEGEPASTQSKWQQVLPMVRKLPGVVSAAPFATGAVMVVTDNASSGIEIYGLPPTGAEVMKAKLAQQLVKPLEGEPAGSLSLEDDEIVLNDVIANELRVGIGDTVDLLATSNMPELVHRLSNSKDAKSQDEKLKLVDQLTESVQPKRLTITGILRADTTWGRCYVPLHIAQEVFGLDGRVHGVGIELNDAHTAGEFTQQLLNSNVLPPDWGTSTWMDRHHSRLAAIQSERVMMWFVMSFVVLVAAFSVATTTLTVTVQKRREIGILTALGSRVSQIVGVFMTQATVVALTGTGLGYVAGKVFLYYRNTIRDGLAKYFNIQIFSKDVYFLAEIPAYTQPMDVVIICLVSVVLCLLAAFLPAYFAARVDPAVALRD